MSGAIFLQDSIERIKTPPEIHEYEISIFGKGYGESIVISCGNKDFIIVDSFLNPETGRPIALDYLDCMDISYSKIKQIVITHWHDDHVRGIHNIIEEANEDVNIVLNPIVKEQTFLNYLFKGISEGGNNGLSEFRLVWNYVKKHTENVQLAKRDTRIFSDEINHSAELYTLAPQDSELLDYIDTHIMKNLTDRVTSYYYQNDNELSLVLLLKKDNDGALLGGDLQNSKKPDCGWEAVVKHYSHKLTRPTLYKIPHHGSETGYNEGIWTEVLGEFPISVVTSFNRNKALPNEIEIQKIKEKSRQVYVVGGTKKDKDLERKIEKIDPGIRLQSLRAQLGMVRYRKRMDNGKTTIDHFGHVKIY